MYVYVFVACEQRRVNCQLTTPPKATQSAGKQTRKHSGKTMERGRGRVTHTHTPSNSPISFALLLSIFLLLLPFFYGSRAEAKDAEKFILNEKLFQLHQRK